MWLVSTPELLLFCYSASCISQCTVLIGASLSEPHTSVISLHSACVCLLACLLACLDRPLNVNHFRFLFCAITSYVKYSSYCTPCIILLMPVFSPVHCDTKKPRGFTFCQYRREEDARLDLSQPCFMATRTETTHRPIQWLER